MEPVDPTRSIRWWRDVEVKGRLVIIPENAAPDIVQGSIMNMTLAYEARYKKVVFYLVLGMGVVLVGAILFWLVRMGLGACSKGD